MNKFYSFILLFLLSAAVKAQTYYWVGASGGLWSSASSWSSTSGGSGGFGVPNAAGHNVVFDRNSTVDLDLGTVTLNTLTVTGNSSVEISVVGDADLNLLSTSTTTPALDIDAGSTLAHVTAQEATFITHFGNGAKGLVDGTWRFSSDIELTMSDGPYFVVPETGGLGNAIQVNGTIAIGDFATSPDYSLTGDEYIFLNENSVFRIESSLGTIPDFNWDAGSTVMILGPEFTGPSVSENDALGNVIYDAANQADILDLALINITIQGDLQVLNTNGQQLILLSNGSSGLDDDFLTTVEGDFIISGNSRVILSDNNSTASTVTLQVNGNANIGGLAFDLQSNNLISTNPTTFRVGGDINHTAGTFTTTSTSASSTVDLFIVELNGTAAQNINSVSGSFDNAANQVTLRMNNASGANLLSPLAVGRLSFASANKGVITTSTANVLTVNNNSNDALTINSPDNAGYVDGPVRRNTVSADAHIFPTGGGGVYRPAVLTPASVDASQYQAEYFDVAYSDLSALPPLRGVTNQEYWQIARIAGTTDATVTLSLNGAVPGAIASDAIVTAVYNGSDWVNARGTTGTFITPGTATSGDVTSESTGTFGDYTLGYASQEALPTVLVSLQARKISDKSAAVSWEVTTTSTPSYFEVMKSQNGIDFEFAGTVTGIHGTTRYTYTDNQLGVGTTYYRLRMVDIDGTESLTRIVAVLNGGKDVVIASMTPTLVSSRSRLHITSSKGGMMQVVITDMHGRIIQNQRLGITPGSQDLWLNLHSLSAGTYQLTSYFEGQRVSTIRFMKQ